MAIKKSRKKKGQATPKQIVVRSHAYGAHTRAARGSIKPAILNDALVAKGKELTVINGLASEVHNLLKQYAGRFKESMFWQKMLSRMHAAPDASPVALINSLAGLELNSRYSLRRFGTMTFTSVTVRRNHMEVQVRSNYILRFNNKAAAYRYDVIVLFFNAKGKATGNVLLSSNWFAVHEAAGTIVFDVAIPNSSKLYVLCLRLHGGKDDEALNEMSSQGMSVVKAGSW